VNPDPVAGPIAGPVPGSVPGSARLSLELSCDTGCRSVEEAGAWLPDIAFLVRHAALALPPGPVPTVPPGAPSDAMREVAGQSVTGGPCELHYELSVRLVGEAEGAELNRVYRGVDRPTNVLSFASGLPPLGALCALGDLVFCPDVIAREAREQGKALCDHWAHLAVHGTLHLFGHDHQDDAAAEAMEALEIRLLSGAGIADPYRGTADDPDE